MEAYFDNGATTKVLKEAVLMSVNIMENLYGNPSSLHKKGLEAEHILKDAKIAVAKKMNAYDGEIVFTSGGTESNNLAITGYCMRLREKGEIITTPVEHKCVLNCFENLKKQGFTVKYAPVKNNGCVDEEKLFEMINEKTQLVSVMYVNNEVGAINNISKIYSEIKKINPKCVFHTDAVQAFGKIPMDKNCADLITISGHKIHAPKGVGALYIKKGILLSPIILGGGQENGLRSGTENVPAIGGLLAAINNNVDSREQALSVKNAIIKGISEKTEGVLINSDENSSPFILNISVLGLRSEILLHSLEQYNIFVSSGSACSSNKPSPSHVLTAMGFDAKRIDSSIRISFCGENTIEEAQYFIDTLVSICKTNEKIRRMMRK